MTAESSLHGRMIFAFGARRSGTFWLYRVLTAHPDVAGVPSETHLFSHGIAPLWERFHHGPRASGGVGRFYADRDTLVSATRGFCDALFAEYANAGARYLCERTPLHVLHAGLIAAVYPDARLVHIVRDGRDVARSIAAQTWSPESFESAVTEWRDCVRAGRAAADLGERYVEVRYEDLLTGGREALADLYRRVGLSVDDAALEAGLAEARTERNIDPSGAGVAVQKWRSLLSAEDLAAFDRLAGDLVTDLGYEPSPVIGAGPGTAEERAPTARRRPTLRGALRRLRPGGGSGAVEREAGKRIQVALRSGQDVVDSLLTALVRGRASEVAGLLADGATVRVIGPAGEEVSRGPEASTLLVGSVACDPAFGGRQVRGDVHPGVPDFTAVLEYELPEGGRAFRVVVVAPKDGRAQAVTMYRPPSTPQGAPEAGGALSAVYAGRR